MISFFRRLFRKSDQELKELEQAFLTGAVIVDVRTELEFRQGHLDGSINIPLDEIKFKSEMIRKWNKPVVTVCRSGNRSAMAKGILQAAGIEAYNGGSWTSINTK